jgi:hypothetical protein
MRVLLRNNRIGLYYAGRKYWVSRLAAAADLRTIERAAELSRDESFEQMEIVVDYEDPVCELVLPLRAEKALRDDPIPEPHLDT